ncbi:hypothetical protein SAMN04488074_10735 [Lentzea albidocapillata subsp. violacea]|uniref:Short chain dehydrogenase n=1 Tax=Lentzea albidocapillata subsp. violacea TaxID=128104 RepID=A0A1G9EFU9_9PSEU|nr:hypothetical protein [Lentzea albidocapillata]SDK75022.1 hypothetical protein SAMN04488074_10735 [Lentzea albidocapillata subsp. violacea]
MAAVLIAGADEDAEIARRLVLAGHTVRFAPLDGASAGSLDSLDVLVNTGGAAQETFEGAVESAARVLQTYLPLLRRSAVVVNVSGPRDSPSAAAVNIVTVQYAKAFPRMRINAVEQDAGAVVRMAQVGQDGPTGGYFDATGARPW